MVTKLKLIINSIHWSLAVKAAAGAVAWLFAPWWLFVLVSLILYCAGWFRLRPYLGPFLLFLIVTVSIGPSLAGTGVLFLFFYTLLGLQRLQFINRRVIGSWFSYGMLAAAVSLFFVRYASVEVASGNLLRAIAGGIVLAVVGAGIADWFFEGFEDVPKGSSRQVRVQLFLYCALSGLLLWQLSAVTLFLPFTLLQQIAFTVLGAALILDILRDYMYNQITRQDVAGVCVSAWVGIVLLLAATHWGL